MSVLEFLLLIIHLFQSLISPGLVDTALLVHGFIERNCIEAYRLGKVALQFLNENEDQNELPGT